MTSEKFCLRWNEFESNISDAFRELRDHKDFFDVTLACDDEQIQSHKMILSACSPFFRNILRRNPHQHPLIYLKGVKYTDLQSVLNFMYHGEVNIAQEELNSFLAVAEDLKVKGLTQNQTETPKHSQTPRSNSSTQHVNPHTAKHTTEPHIKHTPTFKQPRPNFGSYEKSYTANTTDDIQEVVPVKTEPRDIPTTTTTTAGKYTKDSYTSDTSHSIVHVEDDSYDYQDDQQVEYEQYEDGQDYGAAVEGSVSYEATGQSFQDPSELLQFVRKDAGSKKYTCTMCERFSHQGKNMVRNHVESQHFPNTFSYPCDLCGEVLSSRSSHMLHRSKKHLNKKNF